MVGESFVLCVLPTRQVSFFHMLKNLGNPPPKKRKIHDFDRYKIFLLNFLIKQNVCIKQKYTKKTTIINIKSLLE